MNARTRRLATVLFAAASVSGVAWILAAHWRAAATELRGSTPVMVGAAFLLAAAAMAGLASPWCLVLRELGADVSWARSVAWYFTGELGKYAPGGFWAVIGRGERARRSGIRAGVAYSSVATSLVLAYAAAASTVAIGSTVFDLGLVGAYAWALVLPPAIAVALRPSWLRRLVRVVEGRLGRSLDVVVPSWSASVRLVACYLPAWLLIGAATTVLAISLAPQLDPAETALVAVTSWIVGFVVVIAPGGLGVREATFAALVPLPFGRGLAIAVAARVMFVLVDIVAAGVAAAGLRRGLSSRTSARGAPSVLDDVMPELSSGAGPRARVDAPVRLHGRGSGGAHRQRVMGVVVGEQPLASEGHDTLE